MHHLDLGYPESSLALEVPARAAELLAGDRAPDAPIRGAAGQPTRLFELFKGLHWTLLGYDVCERVSSRAGLRIHTVGAGGDVIDDGGHLREAYGLRDGEWVLVRPDATLAPSSPAITATRDAPRFRVLAAYGTSQKVDRLYPDEFAITPAEKAAFRLAGLSFPIKFNLSKALELPFSTTWFDVPRAAPFGQSPQLGVLHPNLLQRAAAAWGATASSAKR